MDAIWEFEEHLKSMYDFISGKTENDTPTVMHIYDLEKLFSIK